jgi:hypothetical protein
VLLTVFGPVTKVEGAVALLRLRRRLLGLWLGLGLGGLLGSHLSGCSGEFGTGAWGCNAKDRILGPGDVNFASKPVLDLVHFSREQLLSSLWVLLLGSAALLHAPRALSLLLLHCVHCVAERIREQP